ncbi:MarR family winged helix-turn-helix transcriptional regulator [Streptomyces kunmingensis]|uniref:MarR family winged helix-turn-helix transcriptional regulator n=1 Tax=Streptomyces kunmingensis TaxID=68225 RepID=A0ABU6CKD2_9ACTN|nr:MarR family winged helix-turn-helix transcriptional regulator [Streptomyces kunmingensis]MEB3965184.1 MarR family winged helix-turn-helix transcriptional regulator [Streptomyces kunmingensis]
MTDEVGLADLLTRRLGYLMKHAYLRLADLLGEALAPYDVHPKELGVLSVIAADGAERSQNELAAAIGMDRTTMVAVIDGLQGKGLVERHRSVRDRRRNVVTLTEAGSTCLRDADRARVEAEAAFLAPLDADTAARLTAALRTLYDAHETGSAAARAVVPGQDAAVCFGDRTGGTTPSAKP